jgi:hypothetical protein
MFITANGVKKAIKEVLYDGGKGREKIEELNKEIDILKTNIKDLELKKRLEEEEIKHLVKMKEEKQAIEIQKKEIDLAKAFQQKEMELQSKYHDKIITTIEESRKESRDLYTAIMDRLPNVNVEMKR